MRTNFNFDSAWKLEKNGWKSMQTFQAHRRLELKAKAFKSRVESLRSRRLGRQRPEMNGDDGGTDSSQTAQQWSHLCSVSLSF